MLTHIKYGHGGESSDLRGIKMAGTCQNPSIQLKLSVIFPLILIRLACDMKQIPRKNEGNRSILTTFIWLIVIDEQPKFRPKVTYVWVCCCHFPGYLL